MRRFFTAKNLILHLQFSRCVKLQNLAVKLCHRKRVLLDVTEISAICYLYTSIFLFK